ncbi:MAG: DUF4160 domain-containing protein [Thermoanaerobaculia bacterium]
MPIISSFFGIIIRMFFDDNTPPHFHAEFQGESAIFDLSGRLLAGRIHSTTARRLIREWARVRTAELQVDWKLAKRLEPLDQIPPLE